MKNKSLFFVCSFFIVIYLFAGNLQSYSFSLGKKSFSENNADISTQAEIKIIQVNGNISIAGSTNENTVYMHIPICCKEQVPIYIKVECNRVQSYRFIKYDETGVLMAANLVHGWNTLLKWTAFLLTKVNSYDDMPESVQMSELSNIPDSVKQWLLPTDCSQSDNLYINEEAKSIAIGETNLINIAKKVVIKAYSIPWSFNHNPVSFDAYYALNWGSSCTGHTHAAVALLRALGIPARSILNIPYWYTDMMDQHWIADFFVPNYGWVNIEPSLGQFAYPTSSTVITYISNASDEFPAFYITGCDTKWTYSEPNLGEPGWGGAHHSDLLGSVIVSPDTSDSILSVSRRVFNLYTDSWGLPITGEGNQIIQSAYSYQCSAFNKILNKDVKGFITDMNTALSEYISVGLSNLHTIYFNDFESNNESFTHYGTKDQWVKGAPQKAPYSCYSGSNCWGTKMEGMYDNFADCYLESPTIDLSNLNCAYLSFWTWNSVADLNSYKTAGFHVEATTDGVNYKNIMGTIGGKIDDPTIPQKGGWTNIIVDLSNFIGNKIKTRFHFTSQDSKTYEGSYIDDFKVYGRDKLISSDVTEMPIPATYVLYDNYPNPFNSSTRIKFYLSTDSYTNLAVYDLLGREVAVIANAYFRAGNHEIDFNARDFSSGVYFYKLTAGSFISAKKLILIK